MWTDTTRAQYARTGLALPTDLTDGEWAVLEPFFPPPSYVGRPRKWPMRRIVEACKFCQIAYKTLPGIGEIIDGRVSLKALRDDVGHLTTGFKRLTVNVNTRAEVEADEAEQVAEFHRRKAERDQEAV